MEMSKERQIELFKSRMPDNLYQNHYLLNQMYPDFTPDQWRTFLKEHEHFIRTEVSAITEAEARLAVKKLSQGNAKSADISAIKQLLDQSEILNAKTKDQRTFIVTNMPEQKPHVSVEQERYQTIRNNTNNVKNMFNLKSLEDENDFYNRLNVKRNADGTLHFVEAYTALDQAYLRLFNPTNYYLEKLPPTDEGDVQ